MNARARALVASLRGILDGESRARAVNAHAGAWLQVHVTITDDATVDVLGAELGLDPAVHVSHEGASWYRAASSEDDAAITVIGPLRTEEPSDDRAQP